MDAQARWSAALGYPVQATPLYQTRWPFPGEDRAVTLLGAALADGTFSVCAVAAGLEPWWVAAPDWETTRKGKREREIDILRLCLGHALYGLRTPGPPTEKLLAQAERRLQTLRRAPQVAQAEVLEVIHVPKHGGAHITFRVTRTSGATEYQNQEGRTHTPCSRVLQAIEAHPTQFFLALSFLGRLQRQGR